MTQVYHHYSKLEEHKAGMWRNVTGRERDECIAKSGSLMRDIPGFTAAMLRAVKEWPISCEAALTTPGLNQRAWLGHAGCCIQVGSPEEPTRQAWHYLTITEQNAANAAADEALWRWEQAYYIGDDQLELFDA